MTLCQAKTLPDRCFNDSTNLRSAYLLRECGFRVISDDCRRIAQGARDHGREGKGFLRGSSRDVQSRVWGVGIRAYGANFDEPAAL